MILDRNVLKGKPKEIFVESDSRIVGTGAKETINVAAGITIVFNAGAGDRVRLEGPLNDYTISAIGNQLIIIDADGNIVTLYVGSSEGAHSFVEFNNGEAALYMSFGADGPRIHLGNAIIPHGETLHDPEDVNLEPVSVDIYALNELVGMETLPSAYKIDPDVQYEPELVISDVISKRGMLEEIVDKAVNRDTIDLNYLFAYRIQDSSNAIIAHIATDVVVNAGNISITDDTVSVTAAMALRGLNTFDGKYSLFDAFEILWDNQDVVTGSTRYSLTEEAGYHFGALYEAQILFIKTAGNYDVK